MVTGPIFDIEENSLVLLTDTPHRVPDKFFKVIVNNLGHTAAFILAQSAAVHVHHCEMIATIDEIEGLTGLDLFPSLNLKSGDSVYSGLGCL